METEPLFDSGMAPVIDSTVMRVPDALNPMVDGVLVVARLRPLYAALTEQARRMLTAQNPGNVLRETEWTIATTAEQAAEWPLPHDCDQCRDGRAQAVAALTAEPARPIALGVLYYDEPR